MDIQSPRVPTSRLAGPGRGPAFVAAVALLFIGAAVVIAALPTAQTPAPRLDGTARALGELVSADSTAAVPSPSPSPSPTRSLRPGEMACLPAGWRLASTGRIGSWMVETRLVVEPGRATGPLDAGIPVADLGSEALRGLGACAPPLGPDGAGRPAVISHAWRIRGAGSSQVATAIGLVALDGSIPAASDRPDALELVRPADGPAGVWAAGAYVLELGMPVSARQPASAASVGWIRIQVDAPAP